MTGAAESEVVEFGYKPPRSVAENLWEISGEWKNKFGRRMTVIKLQDERLIIHNAIRLQSTDINWLKSLGKPSFIVAPNVFHCSDAGWMAGKFPDAELFVPAPKMASFKNQGHNSKDVNLDFPSALSDEFQCIPIKGMRINEAAFLHRPSRTLILCDSAFNMGDVFTGFERAFMKWNKIGGRFGPSRLTKWVFANDRKKLHLSYQEILQLDFDRVIVNHGDILESGGRDRLRSGVTEIFGDA
ncbi:MAG: hypothetical protein C5B49_10395 [Bdellovibrio sp.]|nr:MAG: hypothetical protein C5B49_10395 [Bdellovibrio sp.]